MRITIFENRIFKRCVATLMAAVILFTSMGAASLFTSVFGVSDKPYITLDGEIAEKVVLDENAKLRLSAHSKTADGGYSWQIAHPEDKSRWIDIGGIYSDKLWLTAALVGSMLDDSGNTAIRCRLTVGDAVSYSDPVNVLLSYIATEHASHSYPTPAPQPMLLAEEDENITYSIVIKYLFDDNTVAFEPYGATVAKNSSFTEKIITPEIVGYEPFRRDGENYISAREIQFDLHNINSDVIINVVYEPALVDYKVHHHKQDLYDDSYSVTPDIVTEGKALTGSIVGDGLALTEERLPGFKALAYERLKVAADSSTVIEIRYDRNYYLVDFDMRGGYGAEPVYTRYESVVGVNEPIRHGYVFDGWELVSYGGAEPTAEQKSKYDINGGKTIIVPDANLRYRAKWITSQTEYTMVFWKENADDNGYTYWGYLDGIAALSGDVVSARDLISQVGGIDDEAYFTFNQQKSDSNVLVEGDGSTVVNVYYTRNRYTITFKATGLCTIPEGHTHTDDCYENICDKGHVHDASCKAENICGLDEHTAHTDACISCGKVVHVHGGDGCACIKTEHTHAYDCWPDVGSVSSRPTFAPTSPEDGYVYYRSRKYYIYIKGTWYRYEGDDAFSGAVVQPTCGLDEHSHGNDCSCNIEAHTHNDSCYKDGLHSHTDSCYQYSCGESEHTHSDACYRLACDKVEGHRHSSTCLNSSRTNTVKTLTAKYQESIDEHWPVTDGNGVKYDSGQRWTPSSSSFYSNVLVHIDIMPPDDFTLTLSTSSADTYTMNYYLQTLEDQPYSVTYDGVNYALRNTIKANYNYVTEEEDFFNIKGFVQKASDPAFSGGQIDINGSNKTINFYYDRISDKLLEFNNNGNVINSKTVRGLLYGQSLKGLDFIPDYPANLEPGAYTFAGWYTSSGCFDGTEVDWDTITMPEENLMLYAKWAPITHRVRVFKTAALEEQIGTDIIVNHRAFASEPAGSVVNGNYVFQGWFYMDDGVEKAFVFKGIPVTENMDIYAKWSSHVSVDYSIKYLLRDTDIPVADPTYGSTIAGNNMTFQAKAGDSLYEGYRKGYYPHVNSHTITMSVDGDHSFIFWYDYVESVPYLVRYVNKATGEVIQEKRVEDNNLSVVTETFIRITGMMPDAYQKRLVLASQGKDANDNGIIDSNELTFYYSSDSQHAYYRVVHYIQNISANDYREYRSEETVGNIGDDITVSAITLTGFEYAQEKTVVSGATPILGENSVTAALGAEGLLIELYYDRKKVNYTVEYLDAEYQPIADIKEGSGLFGQQMIETALDLSDKGYKLVGESSVRMLTLSANEESNVLRFIYDETNVSLQYVIVGDADSGALLPYSENIKAVSGSPSGSLPTAKDGYVFAGWYLDSACQRPVDPAQVGSDNRFTPVRQGGIWREATYYAKFDALQTDLTIATNSVALIDGDQSFLFNIKGKAGTATEDINLNVAVQGNGSVTITELPTGEYTLTQLTGWSWRYNNISPVRELQLEYNGGSNTVVYSMNRVNELWLDGNSAKNNLF
ncbi:MAG: InlB B-repeat-containing protein [Clostridia bacterium]|nr:InlB B-repeat-containing protein [Clostridia bacterium]